MQTSEKQASSLNFAIVLAHVRLDDNGQWLEDHLEDHLRRVAALAETFAVAFDASDWAKLAGLWHDLGKYRLAFQRYIGSASGYDAHIEAPSKVDHSTAGALYAIERMKGSGRILAYLIAGHHAGLPDWQSAETPVSSLLRRLEQANLLTEALTQAPPTDIINAQLPTSNPGQRDYALWIRLLFSCLVDADFLDTEQFMAPEKAVLRSRYLALTELEPRFDSHMAALADQADITPVNQVRAAVLARCREAATQSPGLFSLTVPTGGGKTLASLAFALKHMRHHGHRRIIYVIPYTSIIEQTADVFRRVFGDNAVLEHHSNLDSDWETPHSRLAAENWDAPLIVTTNVQFFESLFAARSSRTRKLHNILNSVVILDEAQLLPPDFLAPILGVIRELDRHYGVSFVLCTATQPALTSQGGFDGKLFDGLDNVREIMGDTAATYALHEQLRRVIVTLPDDLHQPTSWEALAAELQTYPSVLCVVDRREDARTLHGLLPPGALHLSGLMCGQHRADVIETIKRRLAAGEPVRVVSTQLVEAGVDLDFPVVYRALTGLDSIAQAAGRCNREGRLTGLGRVVVFVPPKPPPAGHLRQACDAGRQLLLRRPADPLAPTLFIEYFQSLYWRKGAERLDHHGIMALLKNNQRLEFSFRTAAERFQLISETQRPVIVRYGNNEHLLSRLARPGDLNRGVLRQLQRYVVNIPSRIHQRLLAEGAIQEQQPGVFLQITHLYDSVLGFQVEQAMNYGPDDLIV